MVFTKISFSIHCLTLMATVGISLGQISDSQKRFGAKGQVFPKAPPVPDGPISKTSKEYVKALRDSQINNDTKKQFATLKQIGASGEPRLAWLLSDLVRFSRDPRYQNTLLKTADKLLGIKIDRADSWKSLTNHLIAWDIPAFDGYVETKRAIFTQVVPEWGALMTDQGEVDWRLVSWGGVGIDNRPYNQTDQRINSIPAVDNPKVTDASGGSWLTDGEPVFGVVINGEARAYPRFIMEIREMVNGTLGGRDFAMPYCTLCGSAQVWFTDRVPAGVERPVLRTSGLLLRSNKLMFDVVSNSVFDTFLGNATSGPLYTKGIQLPAHTVISTTWGEWKQAHPETTVLARSEALGRRSDLRTTRDADGPIFPVGDVDPRLLVHDEIVGVVNSDQQAVAFLASEAKKQLSRGKKVSFQGVTLKQESGGLIAQDDSGKPLVAHESFWFGWSQFRPDTLIWKAN